ncbi:unnamed protein product [Pneumocystis jirovecii]|uniref:Aminotransferase class V domain-containing protein n=1 Tax=Pneumocystis jirovecii TaxID=42068 RepID=L0PGY4_PNEJI|nr:unnamed protein product [Pneumocystis jirovecii]
MEDYDYAHVSRLSKRLVERLTQLEYVFFNGDQEHRYPGCINASFAYVEGESLLMALKDIALSSGSACTSASLEPSYVIRSLGVPDDISHSSLRFGIGRFTTDKEIDYICDTIKDKDKHKSHFKQTLNQPRLRGTVLPPCLPLLNIFCSPENVRGMGNSSSLLNLHRESSTRTFVNPYHKYVILLKIFTLLESENTYGLCGFETVTFTEADGGGGGGGGGLEFNLFVVIGGGGGGGNCAVINTDVGNETLRVGGGGGGGTDGVEVLLFLAGRDEVPGTGGGR